MVTRDDKYNDSKNSVSSYIVQKKIISVRSQKRSYLLCTRARGDEGRGEGGGEGYGLVGQAHTPSPPPGC